MGHDFHLSGAHRLSWAHWEKHRRNRRKTESREPPSSTARELANTPVDPTVPYAVHLKQKVQVLQKVSMQHDATFVHCSRFKNFTWSKPLPGWPLNGVANKLHSHRLKLPLWWYSLCQTPFTGPIVENMAQQILQQKDLEQTWSAFWKNALYSEFINFTASETSPAHFGGSKGWTLLVLLQRRTCPVSMAAAGFTSLMCGHVAIAPPKT